MGIILHVAGNLSHSQVEIITPRDSAISSLDHQVVTVRSIPGSLVELSVNGDSVRTDTVRIDGLLDFINIQVPVGDVVFTAKLLGHDGMLNTSSQRRMHVLGPPAFIHVGLSDQTLFADGRSTTTGTVFVFDKWRYRIPDGIIVTVDADSGNIRAEDLDLEKRGTQIRVQDGVAVFEYVAGENSGTAVIRAMFDTLWSSAAVDLKTPYEKFTLVGLATGTAQSAKAKTDGAEVNSSTDYPDGLATDGRVAVYARGTVFNDYRLTASFDNDRRNTSRFYRDIDPDYLYSIYGDNSMLTYDAQTTRQLYARLERDKSYAMIGDYNTDMTNQEFTAYNRTLYGLKAGHQDASWQLSAFGSRTDRKVVQMELRGTGLSGLYNFGYLNVTPGSEKVRIETRDRYHSEVVLKQTDQYRYSDYEIDYAQGTIFFKQPVPAIDVQGNPVYIVVSFEAYDAQQMSYVAGGSIEHKLTDYFTFGVNGVIEQQDPKNYTLLGSTMKVQMNDRSIISGEIGRSDQFSGSGLAYKVESTLSPVSPLSLSGYYRRVENDFSNPTQSGSGRELGTRKYGGSGSYQLPTGTKLSVDYYHTLQEPIGGDVRIRSISGSIDQTISSQFNGTVRMEDMVYNGPSPDTSSPGLNSHSLLASAGLNYSMTQRLRLGLEYERNLGADKDITKPNGAILTGEYKIADPVALQAAQKFFEDGSSLSSVGVTAAPVDGTTFYSKYEVGNAIGQQRNLLSIGLKNRVRLPLNLTGNIGLERTKSLETRVGETPTEDHVAYSGGLEYLPDTPVKASAKAEYGEDDLTRKTNYFAGVDFRLYRDLSAILKWTLSLDNSRKNSGYEDRNHLIIGAAYRPVESDWLNLIGKFEWKVDNNHYLAPFNDDQAAIGSVHLFLEPIQRVELGCKFAYKYGVERSVDLDFRSHTYFYLISGRINLSQRFDVGGEYRLLRQKEAQNWLIGYDAEVGYAMINNLRVSAGYNFKGYKEQDLVDYALWTEGPFIRMSFKFDEGLLGL